MIGPNGGIIILFDVNGMKAILYGSVSCLIRIRYEHNDNIIASSLDLIGTVQITMVSRRKDHQLRLLLVGIHAPV